MTLKNHELSPTDLYIDLLKKSLTFELWPSPPMPLDTFVYKFPRLVRICVRTLTSVLLKFNLQLGKIRHDSRKMLHEGRSWSPNAFTMIGLTRLNNLEFCIEKIIEENIEGDLIETGVWRGGARIFMRGVLAAYQVTDRKVFVADSFKGLPKPSPNRFPEDKHDKLYLHHYLKVSQNEVRKNFEKFGLMDDQVVFLKGWFEESLPHAPIDRLALLRLDGDMYGSTMVSLSNLYPKLSEGGFCIVDDYDLQGCKKAVEDYRDRMKITSELKKIDWTGVYWRKEKP